MNWATTLATLLGGGAIGAGSTLLLDFARSRREVMRQWQGARREIYVDYLSELSRAYENLWAVAHGDYEEGLDEPEAATRRIFRTGQIYQTRQRLKITGPQNLIASSDQAWNELRSFRMVVAAGATTQSPEFLAANRSYRSSVEILQKEIRSDLRVPDL
jgi:hypothetical protein